MAEKRKIDMKTHFLSFLGILMLFGVNTCTDDQVDAPLVGTTWNLQSYEIIDGEESGVGSQGIILIFAEDDHVEGESKTIEGDLSVPGNSYRGTYKLGTDDSLSIEIIGTTKLGLPPNSRYEEYLPALGNASTYEIMGDRLRIFYDEGKKALNFEAE